MGLFVLHLNRDGIFNRDCIFAQLQTYSNPGSRHILDLAKEAPFFEEKAGSRGLRIGLSSKRQIQLRQINHLANRLARWLI